MDVLIVGDNAQNPGVDNSGKLFTVFGYSEATVSTLFAYSYQAYFPNCEFKYVGRIKYKVMGIITFKMISVSL